MSDIRRELWNELNHWWMWVLIVVVIAVEIAATIGWLPVLAIFLIRARGGESTTSTKTM